MTKIKICGIRRDCDIEYANELHPEYIGFVFFEKSHRFVSRERATALREKLASGICPVGVFVNTPPERVSELLNTGIIDMAQLHGQEDENYIWKLRKLTEKPIMKAFSIGCAEDVVLAVNSTADYILLDNGSGGTGESFDWSLTAGVSRDYFLAGGLNAGNVAQAVEQAKPYAIDVSSGVETDGFKDLEKMRRLVETVKKK